MLKRQATNAPRAARMARANETEWLRRAFEANARGDYEQANWIAATQITRVPIDYRDGHLVTRDAFTIQRIAAE